MDSNAVHVVAKTWFSSPPDCFPPKCSPCLVHPLISELCEGLQIHPSVPALMVKVSFPDCHVEILSRNNDGNMVTHLVMQSLQSVAIYDDAVCMVPSPSCDCGVDELVLALKTPNSLFKQELVDMLGKRVMVIQHFDHCRRVAVAVEVGSFGNNPQNSRKRPLVVHSKSHFCNICLAVPPDEVFQCVTGHLFCSEVSHVHCLLFQSLFLFLRVLQTSLTHI
jgi:hypothetical protein